MNSSQDRWDRLNAYVDGELDPQARAAVAAEIARDRELAAAAATLTHLKAATGDAFADAPEIRVRAGAPPRMRRPVTIAAMAAGVCAAVAIAWFAAAPSTPEGLDVAVSRHASWVAGDGAGPVDSRAAPLLVGLARLDRPVELPDLRDAGLQIVRIAVIDETAAAPGLHVAYLGSRGCRVSLIVTKADSRQEPVRLQRGDTAINRWAADGLAYTLMSSGMPPERFALIAAAVQDAVRRHAPVPEPVREALRRDREGTQPCIG